MMLSFWIFYLFFSCVMALVKQRHLVNYHYIENKNTTTSVLSKSKRGGTFKCAATCLELESCESFFYNTVTGECQYHGVVITSSVGFTDQEGLQYCYIMKGGSDWCPVETGFRMLAEDEPCVKFHTDKKTWYEANQTCASFSPNSRLVVLHDYQKNELVRSAGMAINNRFCEIFYISIYFTYP